MILSRFWAVGNRLWTKVGHILDIFGRISHIFWTYFDQFWNIFWIEFGHIFDIILNLHSTDVQHNLDTSRTHCGHILNRLWTYYKPILNTFWTDLSLFWKDSKQIWNIIWLVFEHITDMCWKMDKLLTYIKQNDIEQF